MLLCRFQLFKTISIINSQIEKAGFKLTLIVKSAIKCSPKPLGELLWPKKGHSVG